MSSLNEPPRSERLHIGIFGRRNAGKSTLLNAITGQDLAVVSPVKGTTTDPVFKAMELLPLGPVVLIDTPGFDDIGMLGALRIKKTRDILRKTDVAILVINTDGDMADEDKALIELFEKLGIPYLIVYNTAAPPVCTAQDAFWVNAQTGENIFALKEKLAEIGNVVDAKQQLVADLIESGDILVLVVPIDSSAPKGRLILPQQQVIRDVLDANGVTILTQPEELRETLDKLKTPPRMVITDSQVFKQVAEQTPEDISLTSFSILMARYKGMLAEAVQGAKMLDSIQDGNAILIAEGCTHHRQCDDIGTVKLPRWIAAHTNATPVYTFTSGTEFPENLTSYKLIIHCGGCMLNTREMHYRQRSAQDAGIAMTNFGVAISHMQGILERCVEALP